MMDRRAELALEMAHRRRQGLSSSIWASAARRSIVPDGRPPSPPAPDARMVSRAQALHRFEQACGRLRWKAIDLEHSYGRAQAPQQWAFSSRDAERNFKVDFHEFYLWIEQALVLLLKLSGTHLDSSRAPRARPGRAPASPSSSASASAAAHAYHHNVLKALQDESNPLHTTLGRGDVIHALWKAKELRNRWKDAAEGLDETPPLKMYDLKWIVNQVMAGLEAAYQGLQAQLFQELAASATSTTVAMDQSPSPDDWEWMVDPMDWEP